MRDSQLVLKIALAALAAALITKRLLRGSRIRPEQVAVITGSSTGLGLALAHRFGRAGLKLVLAAREKKDLETLESSCWLRVR